MAFDGVEHNKENSQFSQELADHFCYRVPVFRRLPTWGPSKTESQHALRPQQIQYLPSGTEYDGLTWLYVLPFFHNLYPPIPHPYLVLFYATLVAL